MSVHADETAITLTEQTLEANKTLQENLGKHIIELESERDELDALIKTLSKVESALPEEQIDDEIMVETAPYGANYERPRPALTSKQLSSEASPFYQAVMQRQRYERLTSTRPFTREEIRLLHVGVIIENKRLHALRARARGEDPFAAVEAHPDSFFDKNDPEISWSVVAENVLATPPRTADQCRITYVSAELPSINRSDWTLEEFESLKSIVEVHNSRSTQPVENIEEQRDKLRVDWVEIARELGTNRTALQCLKQFALEPPLRQDGHVKHSKGADGRKIVPAGEKSSGHAWTKEEDKHLLEGIQRHGLGNWPEVALHLNNAMSGTPGYVGRTPNQCSFRYTKSLCPTIKKGRWSVEEDEALRKGVAAFGRTWIKVQEYVQGRTDAQCRERWLNMLDPSLKTGPWDPEEDRILLDAASRKLPWSAVSALLPGRTDSRCAKRHQILTRPPGEPQSTASVKKRRSKQQSLVDLHTGNSTEGITSTGITSDNDRAVGGSFKVETVVPSSSRPRLKPKMKVLVEDSDESPQDFRAVEPVENNSLQGELEQAEPSSEQDVPERSKARKGKEANEKAHTSDTRRRSGRIANRK